METEANLNGGDTNRATDKGVPEVSVFNCDDKSNSDPNTPSTALRLNKAPSKENIPTEAPV